ncbi:hypothetical protein RMATCC62417_12346 [Rhizopus microsporus]|nr:hypothetical protein RMATCC62417_12346 [Rhizopus microsporus]
MVHNGKHSHSAYLPKHLTVAEKCRLYEKVDEAPHVKPSKTAVGVSSRTGEVVPSIYNSVGKILINKDRAKYELNNAMQRMGVSSRTNFLGEFEKVYFESYHSALYTVIVKEQPLVSFLRYLLQYAKKDGQSLSALFTDRIQPCYGQNKRQRDKERLSTFTSELLTTTKQSLTTVEHVDKTTTDSKKRKLPEVADTDNEKDDFQLGTHNFLKQLIEEQLSVEGVPNFSMNNMNAIEDLFFQLKETDLLREFVAEDKLKKFIEKYYKDPSNERKQKQKDYSELVARRNQGFLIKDTDHEADEAVNKEYDVGNDNEMAIDLTERTPEQHAASIHRYNKTLRPNTANSCYIDAIFELLWHSVMPHFEEVMLSNFDPHNKFDSTLKTSYKWHRLNTDDGRSRASYSMRKLVWENKISNRGEGFWGDCNEALETFLNNILPSARSFCDIGQFYTYKICSRNQSHSGAWIVPVELGEDSAELPDIITRHNLIETEKLPPFLFVSDLTNIAPTALKKTPQQFPYIVEIAETKYILHGKVYSTEPSGVHFYTVSKISFNGTTSLANLDNLSGNNLQVLDTNENNSRHYLENPVNTKGLKSTPKKVNTTCTRKYTRK